MGYSEVIWRECVKTFLQSSVKRFGLEGSISCCLTFLIAEIDKPQYEGSIKDAVEEIRNFFGAYGLEV